MPTLPTIVSGGTEFLNPKTILSQHVRVLPNQMVGALGCGGAGFFALEAARMVGNQGQVYAVDIVKNALSSVDSKAKLQGLYNFKTVWSDLEVFGATAIPEKSLDLAMLVNILFQSKQHEAIIRESARLIKPGGKLLIIDWNQASVAFGPKLSDRVDQDAIRALVPQLGFQEDKIFEAGQYHFGLLYTRL